MPKPNGFLVFVRHRQLKSMKEGKPIESLKEAVNIFGGEWDVMNAADRKIFKDKAKRFRLGTLAPESFTESTIINDSTPSSSGKGNPKQFSCVNSLLEESNPTNVLFVVMSCNYFCHTRSNPYCYVPAEIGMCAFSIKLGVIDNYWTLVDPQILPKGKLLEAKELHELHRVPLPPFEPRFQDLERILLNISHFLQRYKPESQDWTNIFCVPSDTRIIEGCLNWLVQTVGARDGDLKFKMQQLPCLLYKLNQISLKDPLERVRRNWACKLVKPLGSSSAKKLNFSSIGQCSDFLSSTKRNFEESLSCPYHEKVALQVIHNCSLCIVNRFAMNILEVLAPRFRIPTKLGFHIPLENSEEQGKNRNKFLIRWGYLPEYLDYMEVDSDDESACCRCRQYHPSFDNDTFDFGKALRLPLSEEEGFSFAPQPIQEDTEIASMIAEVKPANCLFEDLKGKNSDCSTEISDGFSFASGIDFDKSDNVSILGGEIYKYHIEMHGYSWSDFFW